MIYPLNPPLAELLLLSIISKEDSYGYIISQSLKKVSNLKDSALYPMLKRLSDQRYVEIYDRQYQGRNRKYYRITPVGDTHREELENEWKAYCSEIKKILDPVPQPAEQIVQQPDQIKQPQEPIAQQPDQIKQPEEPIAQQPDQIKQPEEPIAQPESMTEGGINND